MAIPILLLSTAWSAVLGFWATLLYRLEGPGYVPWTSSAVGGVAGALAALGWIDWMRNDRAGCRCTGNILHGVVGGVVAGSLASLMLHLGISAVAPSPTWWIGQLVGQGFGVLSGAILGLAGGAGWGQRSPPRT